MGIFKKEDTVQIPTLPPTYVNTPGAESMTELDKFTLTRKTDEEKKKVIEDNRPKGLSPSTLLYRRIKLNLDIMQMVALMIFACGAGTSVTVIILRFSLFVMAIFSAALIICSVGLYVFFMWRLHTPPGVYSKNLIQAGSKAVEQLGLDGRTIIGK